MDFLALEILSLRDDCSADQAAIPAHVLAFELDHRLRPRMLAGRRSWNWTHGVTSHTISRPQTTHLQSALLGNRLYFQIGISFGCLQ